jgi:hypothetical protein
MPLSTQFLRKKPRGISTTLVEEEEEEEISRSLTNEQKNNESLRHRHRKEEEHNDTSQSLSTKATSSSRMDFEYPPRLSTSKKRRRRVVVGANRRHRYGGHFRKKLLCWIVPSRRHSLQNSSSMFLALSFSVFFLVTFGMISIRGVQPELSTTTTHQEPSNENLEPPLVAYFNNYNEHYSAEDDISPPSPSAKIPSLLLRGSTTSSGSEDERDAFPIVFPKQQQQTSSSSSQEVSFRFPKSYEIIRRLSKQRRKGSGGDSRDFGGLEISSSSTLPGAPRVIQTYEEEEEEYAEEENEAEEEEDEGEVANFALDDDYQEAVWAQSDERDDDDDDEKEEQEDEPHCRRIQEYRYNFQNCNELHQLDHAGGNVLASGYGYINHGFFRDVFSINHQNQEHEEKLAIKQIRYEDSAEDLDYHEYVRMDAIVAERLTASPRTFDIYGFCGLAILSEFFYHGDIEDRSLSDEHEGYMNPAALDDEDDVDAQNDLTPEQKLVLAFDMAEGLADLHGYAHGLIIHDDIQMSQFLLNKDRTRLKLNDFNRAEFPLWDDTRQEYCRYKNGEGRGIWRSPEEYNDEGVTEGIDVWSLGNNIYGLLTGLNPFYDDAVSLHHVQKRIKDGETAYIDPRYAKRSKAERVLVSVIDKCHEYYPKDRPTIFEVVKELSQAVSELIEQQGISRASILQGI